MTQTFKQYFHYRRAAWLFFDREHFRCLRSNHISKTQFLA